MRKLLLLLAILLPSTAAASPTVGTAFPIQPPPPILGRWMNPHGTLIVQTRSCGPNQLCGAVVWASATAMADARAAGVATLVGTQLLQGYIAAGDGSWNGRVYVPDMGRSFASRIRQPTGETLSISGCLIGGLFCKQQVWHRVG